MQTAYLLSFRQTHCHAPRQEVRQVPNCVLKEEYPMRRNVSPSHSVYESMQKHCSRCASATPYKWRSRQQTGVGTSTFTRMLIKDQASMIWKHAGWCNQLHQAATKVRNPRRSPSWIKRPRSVCLTLLHMTGLSTRPESQLVLIQTD